MMRIPDSGVRPIGAMDRAGVDPRVLKAADRPSSVQVAANRPLISTVPPIEHVRHQPVDLIFRVDLLSVR
jgi:hypothetical protein